MGAMSHEMVMVMLRLYPSRWHQAWLSCKESPCVHGNFKNSSSNGRLIEPLLGSFMDLKVKTVRLFKPEFYRYCLCALFKLIITLFKLFITLFKLSHYSKYLSEANVKYIKKSQQYFPECILFMLQIRFP